MAKFGFDTSEVDVNAQVSYDPLEPGDYTLKATEAVEKDTKSGDGSYLAVTFEVTKGKYEGRKVWMNFNIHNPSEKAQRIGRQQLVAWATAAGKPDAKDTDQLLERSFGATLGIEKGTGGYADRNNIKAFLFEAVEDKLKAAKPAARPQAGTGAGSKGANPWD